MRHGLLSLSFGALLFGVILIALGVTGTARGYVAGAIGVVVGLVGIAEWFRERRRGGTLSGAEEP